MEANELGSDADVCSRTISFDIFYFRYDSRWRHYPNVSAEKLARLFAEHLNKGEVEEITKTQNKVLAPEYHGTFTKN